MNLTLPDFPFHVWICLSVFLLSLSVQLYYYLCVYSKVANFGAKGKPSAPASDEGLSVVVCANNKSSDLEKNLPAVLRQNHPKFEVIVVNDGSSDGSEDILDALCKQYPNLEVRNLVTNNFLHGKSLALGVGIKAAKYDKIVLCDADCTPDSADWLLSLSRGFSGGRKIVNAYTRLEAKKLIRADAFFDALNLMGHALKGKPYSACGSNMAFDKELFFGRKGFDPMLKKGDRAEAVFFNAVARADNVSAIPATKAVNRSSRSFSFGNWRREKSRYLHSQRLFRPGTRNLGLPEMLSRLLMFVGAPASVYFTADEIWFAAAVCAFAVLRLTLQLTVFLKTQRRFNERGLLPYSLLWDIISPLAYIAVFLSFKQRRTFE